MNQNNMYKKKPSKLLEKENAFCYIFHFVKAHLLACFKTMLGTHVFRFVTFSHFFTCFTCYYFKLLQPSVAHLAIISQECALRSVERGMWSAERKVRSVRWRVRRIEQQVENMEPQWSVKK